MSLKNRWIVGGLLSLGVLAGVAFKSSPVVAADTMAAMPATEPKVRIGNATVTTADIATPNGVIHVIDTVLLP